MPTPKIRHYARFWKKLKLERRLVLALPKQLAPKVRRMIQKEKNEDLAFKIQTEPRKWRIKVQWNDEKSQMIFTLVETQFSKSYQL